MFKTVQQIESEAIAAARPMTVVGDYHRAYATAWSMEEVVRDEAARSWDSSQVLREYGDEDAFAAAAEADDNDRMNELLASAVDAAVAACDLGVFDADVQDFYNTAAAPEKLSVHEQTIQDALDDAADDEDGAEATVDVEVFALARINGGFKYVVVDTVTIALAA